MGNWHGAKLSETWRSLRTLETLTGVTILDKDNENSQSEESRENDENTHIHNESTRTENSHDKNTK